LTDQCLLLVDDEINILNSLWRELSFGRDVQQIYTAQNGSEALELLSLHTIHVIISDQRMPHMTGTQLFNQVKILYPYTVCMILSGYADFNVVQDAINQGEVYKFLNKPWKTQELMKHIHDAFNHYALQKKRVTTYHLVDQLLEAVMITDYGHKVESVNTAFCLATDYSAQDIVGSYIDLFDRDQISAEEITDIYDTVRIQSVWQGDIWFRKKSGAKYFVFLSISAIRNEEGKTMCYLYSFLEHTI
jgi:YesN/AraC family two-component response regulator